MNNNSGKQERYVEINITDLIWKIIFSWRTVIIFMLVSALLLCAAKYVNDNRRYHNFLNNPPEDKEELSEEKDMQEAQEMEALANYLDQSVLMSLDPYALKSTVLQYEIDVSGYVADVDDAYATDVMFAYSDYVSEKGLADKITAEHGLDIDPKYVGELISLNYYIGNSTKNTFRALFSVHVIESDREELKDLVSLVERELTAYSNVINAGIGEHSLREVTQYSTTSIDDELIKQQNDLKTKIRLYEESLEEDEEEEPEEKAQYVVAKPVINVKYIIIGAFMGIILSVLYISMKYIFGGKIKSVRELSESCDLDILGTCPVEREYKKGVFGSIDKCLYALRYRRRPEYKQRLELLAMGIILMCQKAQIQELFMLTTLQLNDRERESLETIIKYVSGHSIAVSYGENAAYSVENLKKLAESEQVLIVEKLEGTRYDDLENELNLCLQQHSNILGCIVFQ